MNKEKPSAGRKVFNAFLLILDLALLVWILLSWNGRNTAADLPAGSAVTACADDAVRL